MTEAPSTPLSGVLPRAHAILAAIAPTGSVGIRLKTIAERTGIARPTVYRMLHDLIEIGFVTQLPNKFYTLGHELYWLGLSAPQPFPELPAMRAISDDLARITGDTVYISVREPAGVRYLLRSEGNYPLQSRVVAAGELKPFTASYSGLALLSALDHDFIEAALAHIIVDADETPTQHQARETQMRKALEQVRAVGWCTGENLVMPGLSGIAAPVPNPQGPPVLAVSVSAASTRLTPERTHELAPALLDAAARIGATVSPKRR